MNATVAFAIIGLASWYGPEHLDGVMANGQRFEPWAMTCAAQEYPFGTQLLVVHGDRDVIVRVTDRLGAAAIRHGCLLDLSQAAFEAIADTSSGIVSIRYSIFQQGGAEAARLAHNQKVIGSNPIPAPIYHVPVLADSHKLNRLSSEQCGGEVRERIEVPARLKRWLKVVPLLRRGNSLSVGGPFADPRARGSQHGSLVATADGIQFRLVSSSGQKRNRHYAGKGVEGSAAPGGTSRHSFHRQK